MKAVSAGWIAQVTGGTVGGGASADAVVTSAVKDSRDAVAGSLYVALPGERADGHDFVAAATTAGASLALVTKAVDSPHVLVDDAAVALGQVAKAYLAELRAETGLTVVGITGSNGKTSTKDMLAHVLPNAVAPQGSFNNEIGLPLTVLKAGETTEHLVLEMGASAPGDIAYLTNIAPLNVAVVLMVGSAHAAGYGSLAGLAAEKATILDGLVDGGVGIVNADDPVVSALARRDGAVVTFGFGAADVAGEGLETVRGRARFTVAGESVQLSYVGEHHASNALATIAVALQCGVSLADAAARVSAAVPVSKHRMALTVRPDGVAILDDAYNASPESMRAAFRALLEVADGGRTWAVIGEMLEMGAESIAAHDAIGIDAVRLGVSHLVVVGAGARPAFVSAVREGSWGDEAMFVATIDEARELVSSRVSSGDTVLVKGSNGTGLWRLADELIGVDA